MQHKSEWVWLPDWVWLIVCGLLSSVYCVLTAKHIGPTFDEPFYIVQGLKSWHTGSMSGLLQKGTMPLPVNVTTLPLYLWELLRGRNFHPLLELGRLLPVARAGTLLFWWMLLFYGWKIARGIAGPWGGRLAVSMLAFEPTMLAHASLATTDIAIAACIAALAYHFREGRESGWRLRVGLPSVLYGLALLAKASVLVMGPLCMLVIEVDRLARKGGFAVAAHRERAPLYRRILTGLKPFRRDMWQILGLGFVLMLVYCGCDWHAEPSFVAWAKSLPAGPAASVMVYVAEHLRIFSNGGVAIVRQIKHNIQGAGMFIDGRTDPRAIWYYFPVAMTIKLSPPLLILPLFVAILRPRALVNWALMIAGTLTLFSVTFRVQVGIRIILPLVAFLIVGEAAAAVNTIRDLRPGWAKRVAVGALACCLAWTAAASVLVYPNALCYCNELWGGTAGGYKLLSDSNYDWGQGLGELRNWQRQNHIQNLDVWYFGTDPSASRGPFHLVTMDHRGFRGPEDIVRFFHGRYLAVSTSLLYGGYIVPNPKKGQRLRKSALAVVRYLRSKRPVARTSTFLIYAF